MKKYLLMLLPLLLFAMGMNAQTNLALGKQAYASSVSDENTTLVAANAVDGNTGTKWASNYDTKGEKGWTDAEKAAQWFYVDLGATVEINTVKISWDNQAAHKFNIRYSTEAPESDDAVKTTGTVALADQVGTDWAQNTYKLTEATVQARYIIIDLTERGAWGYGITELEVYNIDYSATNLTSLSVKPAFIPVGQATSLTLSPLDQYNNAIAATYTIGGTALENPFTAAAAGVQTITATDANGNTAETSLYAIDGTNLSATPADAVLLYAAGTATGWYIDWNGAAKADNEFTLGTTPVKTFTDVRCAMFGDTPAKVWNTEINPSTLGYTKLHLSIYAVEDNTNINIVFEGAVGIPVNNLRTLSAGWNDVEVDLTAATKISNISIRNSKDGGAPDAGVAGPSLAVANVYFAKAANPDAGKIVKLSVSPSLVLPGEATELTLTAYDNMGTVISEGVTFSADGLSGTTLTPAVAGQDIVITGSTNSGAETATATIHVVGDIDAPRIPTDVYLPVYTTVSDNTNTVWGWGTDATRTEALTLNGRPAMYFRGFDNKAVNNHDISFFGGDFGVRFNPSDKNCGEVRADIYSAVDGAKVRIRLENSLNDPEYVTLSKGWNTLKHDVSAINDIIALYIGAQEKPDILVANVYFTKVATADAEDPTWETAPKAEHTANSATITAKATDTESDYVLYVLTTETPKAGAPRLKAAGDVDVNIIQTKRLPKGEDAVFTLDGLASGTEYTYYVTAYDEAGKATSKETVTFTTTSLVINRIEVTPATQTVIAGETTAELTVKAFDASNNEITETLNVEYTVKSEDVTGLLTLVAGSNGQFTTKNDITSDATATVTVTASLGSSSQSADVTINVKDANQHLIITYTTDEGTVTDKQINAGTLASLSDYLKIKSLKITSGTLSNADIATLRQMAGAKNVPVNPEADEMTEDGETPSDAVGASDYDEFAADADLTTVGVLEVLDLSGAEFVASATPFAAYSQVERTEGVGTDTGVRTAVNCSATDATTLPNHIFANCTNLKEVTLPTSVTTFAGAAHFANCTNLTTINGLDQITDEATADNAFYNTGLTSIDLSTTQFKQIGLSSFRHCSKLESITFPTALERIGFSAFQRCVKLNFADGYEFPATLKMIDNIAFKECDALTGGLKFPKALNYIGQAAFQNDFNLLYIDIPADSELETIENGAFQNCYHLTLANPVLPNSLKHITNGAFKNCISLGLPKGQTAAYEVVDQATKNAAEILKSKREGLLNNETVAVTGTLAPITLPAALEQLGYEVFGNCRNLDLATTPVENRLPATCAWIDNLAFTDCVRLSGAIQFPLQDKRDVDVDGVIVNRSRINIGVFQNCAALESVSIPEGIEEVSGQAFAGSGLTSTVTLPESLVEIGYGAFNGTQNLTKVEISDHSTATSIKIDNAAFQWSAISELTVGANTTFDMGTHVFFQCPNVDDDLAYLIMSKIDNGGGEAKVLNAVFFQCEGLENLVIPSNITLIDAAAFAQPADTENPDHFPTIKTITVTAAEAPVCRSYGAANSENPFNGLDPNHVEVIFSGDAETGYASYRNTGDQSEFMRMLTKTASEGDRADVASPKAYDVVKQMHGDFILTRTFDENSWNSLVLPFKVSKTQLAAIDAFKDNAAIAAYYDQYEDARKLFIFEVNHDADMHAFKPFLIKVGNKATDGQYTFSDVNINYNDDATTGYAPAAVPVEDYKDGDNKYTYTGTYALTTAIPTDSYVLQKGQGYYTSATKKAASQGFRAWLQPVGASLTSAANVGLLINGSETTGISIVDELTSLQVDKSAVYTLDGRKVSAENGQLPKGVYVIGGRKVVIK